MEFDLGEDVRLLQQSTRELLERESPLSEARTVMEDTTDGFSKSLYGQLGELGYLSLLLPEDDGGMGSLAFVAVMEEAGRHAFPGPFLDAVLAARALAACDSAEAREWRRRATAGECLAVLARSESAEVASASPIAARFSGGRADGTKLFVPFGAQADALLVETRDGLALVPRPGTGWRATPMPTLDHAQRFAEIELANDPAVLIADAHAAAAILADVDRLAALGAAAQLLGVMERCLEMTLDYTKEREAFGVPIASFQALQHRCADMLARTEGTRSATYRAAWATDNDLRAAPYLTAVAKAWAGPAARHVCGETIQMHGGVGFTWEYDPHIYLKRAHTLETFYGSTRSQLDAVLDARRL